MDIKDIKELIRFFDKSNIGEFEIESGDTRLYLSKSAPVDYSAYTHMPQIAPQAAHNAVAMPQGVPSPAHVPAVAQQEIEGNIIESPMIGTYYAASAPGADPFLKIGEIVEKGQTLCIIEAMKIMNTIEAEYRCRITKMYVENGKPVEYGQNLFLVEPV